jgi:hypothetical protein
MLVPIRELRELQEYISHAQMECFRSEKGRRHRDNGRKDNVQTGSARSDNDPGRTTGIGPLREGTGHAVAALANQTCIRRDK